jgi:hypothetical protein
MNKALDRLREYFFTEADFDAFCAQHDVRVYAAPGGAASRVEIFRKDGSRIKDTHSENAARTRRRKLPFMIEHLADDADGVQYVERLDESTTAEPIYMARYLDATGCELRVSHGQGWFLTDGVRAALRGAFGRPLFPGAVQQLAFAPRTVHDRAVDVVFIEMAPRLTLAFANRT